MRLATIYDVAKLAGVSPATVSRAFSKPGRVHEETLARIQKAAEELGYRAQVAPHQSTHERTNQIALLVSDASNPYFTEIIRGAVAAAAEADHSVVLLDGQESVRLEEQALQRVVRKVDGIIMAAPRVPDAPIRAAARELPVVLLNRSLPEVASILPDNRLAVQEAISHLFALGHRSVGYVSGPENSFANQIRWKAVRDASAQTGMSLRLIGPVPPNLMGGEMAARHLTAGATTAALCFNDLIALGIMRELTRMGFTVPRDMSIIGVDNIMSGELVTPQLTTISASFSALGSVAVHTLISIIAGAPGGGRNTTMLPMRLIVRGSTGPANRPLQTSA